MILFNDTEMFTSGMRGKKVYDMPDCDLLLIDDFFVKEEADDYYTTLLNETNWREYEMPMYDKIVTAPRMVSGMAIPIVTNENPIRIGRRNCLP